MTTPFDPNIQNGQNMNPLSTTNINLGGGLTTAQQVQQPISGLTNVYSTGGDGMSYNPVLPSSLAYGFQSQNQPPISGMVLDTLVNIGAQMATVTANVLDWAKTLSTQQQASASEGSGSSNSADETDNEDADEIADAADLNELLIDEFDEIDEDEDGYLSRKEIKDFAKDTDDYVIDESTLKEYTRNLKSLGLADGSGNEVERSVSMDDLEELQDKFDDGEEIDEVVDDLKDDGASIGDHLNPFDDSNDGSFWHTVGDILNPRDELGHFVDNPITGTIDYLAGPVDEIVGFFT